MSDVREQRIYCAEQIYVPENLPTIIKHYSKEVIKNNPDNIIQFSMKYFERLLRQRDNEPDKTNFSEIKKPDSNQISAGAAASKKYGDVKPNVLSKIKRIFEIWDSNGSGYVSVSELKDVFEKLGYTGSYEDVQVILNGFDVNADGRLSFDEFVETVRQIGMMEQLDN